MCVRQKDQRGFTRRGCITATSTAVKWKWLFCIWSECEIYYFNFKWYSEVSLRALKYYHVTLQVSSASYMTHWVIRKRFELINTYSRLKYLKSSLSSKLLVFNCLLLHTRCIMAITWFAALLLSPLESNLVWWLMDKVPNSENPRIQFWKLNPRINKRRLQNVTVRCWNKLRSCQMSTCRQLGKIQLQQAYGT